MSDIDDLEQDFEDEDAEQEDRDIFKALPTIFKPTGKDPATIPSWPPTLPIEVALQSSSIKAICEGYGLTRGDWDRLRADANFVKDVQTAAEELKKDGMTFKFKARLQSEELLKTAWRMIHDEKGVVPATVRADLIKFTIRVAGLDASKEQGQNAGPGGTALNIQINL